MAAPATPTSGTAPPSTANTSISHSTVNGLGSASVASASAAFPSASSSNDIFVVGEKALCYHGPLVYEAKILQTADFEEPAPLTGVVGMHYFVHYKGWKRTWDEWVPASRLLKMNEQNLAHQKALQNSHQSIVGAAGGPGSHHKAGGGGGHKASGAAAAAGRKDARGTKRGRDEDDPARKTEMKLIVPEVLKQILVNDWEYVTKENKLVDVPTKITVLEILEGFSKYIMEMDPKPAHLREPEKLIDTITSGLQTYFDKSLGTNLLYRFERPQYAQIRKQYWTGQDVVIGTEKEMSSIYGAEHLLRMLVSLPTMVAQSSLDKGSLDLIRDYTNELIQYMAQERDRIFQKEYIYPGSMYSNVSRS
ncbi:MRG-domain-containing protein [Coprinopsis sp. MPI-PUGE-AT-0042]|nr:MRG-domain-containing protein [Coprinopsis sp. MPI-PUGE-AT-0042]